MERGSIWWGSFGKPTGSMIGYRRPVVIVQSNRFNRSNINTVVVVPLTTNLALVEAPGNVLLKAKVSGLSRDSVANVSLVSSVDKSLLTEFINNVPAKTMAEIDDGLRRVLEL